MLMRAALVDPSPEIVLVTNLHDCPGNPMTQNLDAFICDAVRTPFGHYGGSLSSVRTDNLGAVSLKALIERNKKVDRQAVADVLYGCANQAGEDNRNVARTAALAAELAADPLRTKGSPIERLSHTIRRLCMRVIEDRMSMAVLFREVKHFPVEAVWELAENFHLFNRCLGDLLREGGCGRLAGRVEGVLPSGLRTPRLRFLGLALLGFSNVIVRIRQLHAQKIVDPATLGHEAVIQGGGCEREALPAAAHDIDRS